VPDYFQHQHSQNKGSDSTVVPVSALYDQVKPGAGGVEHAREGVKLSVGNQMAPYKPPPKPLMLREERGGTFCTKPDCNAYPMRDTEHGYCSGHARSYGLVETWSTKKKKKSA
jgi:hypothetical protein